MHFLSFLPTPLYSAQLFSVLIQIKKVIVFLLTFLETALIKLFSGKRVG